MDNQVSRRKGERLRRCVAGEIARILVMFTISPPAMMAHAALLPADSPQRGALAEGCVSPTSQAKDQSPKVAPPGARGADAKQSQPANAQTQRVRELIYYFHNYRAASRVEE